MAANPDFKDLLKALNQEQAKYLLIGAYAVVFYTEPRYTKDFDLWIASDEPNIDKIWSALAKFGAPLEQVKKTDLSNPEMIYQIGIAPNRIDILNNPGAIDFEMAWKNRNETTYDGEALYIIGIDDLIKTKKAAGRPQDLLDIESLKKVQ